MRASVDGETDVADVEDLRIQLLRLWTEQPILLATASIAGRWVSLDP